MGHRTGLINLVGGGTADLLQSCQKRKKSHSGSGPHWRAEAPKVAKKTSVSGMLINTSISLQGQAEAPDEHVATVERGRSPTAAKVTVGGEGVRGGG